MANKQKKTPTNIKTLVEKPHLSSPFPRPSSNQLSSQLVDACGSVTRLEPAMSHLGQLPATTTLPFTPSAPSICYSSSVLKLGGVCPAGGGKDHIAGRRRTQLGSRFCHGRWSAAQSPTSQQLVAALQCKQNRCMNFGGGSDFLSSIFLDVFLF